MSLLTHDNATNIELLECIYRWALNDSDQGISQTGVRVYDQTPELMYMNYIFLQILIYYTRYVNITYIAYKRNKHQY